MPDSIQKGNLTGVKVIQRINIWYVVDCFHEKALNARGGLKIVVWNTLPLKIAPGWGLC